MAIYLTLTNQLLTLANNLRITATEVGIFGDSTFRTSYLNLGQKAFIRDTRALSGNKDTSLVSVTDQAEYDLWTITGYLMVDFDWGILFDGKKINYKTPQQMFSEFGKSWLANASGNPSVWYLRGKRYLGLGPNKPSSTYASKTITVFFIKRPADMAAGTDTPFDSSPFLEEYTEAPVLWASWKLFLRAKQYNDALYYKKLYDEKVIQCIADLKTDTKAKEYLKPVIYNSQR